MADLSGRIIKLILTNNFHYTGKVLEDSEDAILILDKNNSEVTIQKGSIMIQEVLQ